MCGIAGFWTRRAEIVGALAHDLKGAVDSLKHRGPDDSDTWTNNAGLGLGHTRLSVLDLSERGHQPMVSEDGIQVLVYNGEVYNFREIRSELERLGYRFRSNGDAEVVMTSLREWGTDALQRFVGMFAFALWNERTRTLRLYRDRVGIKPLYYGWDGSTFWFGSELKALRSFRHWTPTLNCQALGEYFQYGYVASPRSIYKEVHKIPPGHWLEIHRDGGPRTRPYWAFLTHAQHVSCENEEVLTKKLEALLTEALLYRMVSDVPVGVFLSGGIDSSIVAAILSRNRRTALRTFTVAFRERSHDEASWARQIAHHLGTDHEELILNSEDVLRLLPQWAEIYDEPFGDASGLPTYLVSKVSRKYVTVALSGDGGDELFGGYDRYTQLPRLLQAWNRIPTVLRKGLRTISGALPQRRVASIVDTLTGRRLNKVHDRVDKLSEFLLNPEQGHLHDLTVSLWLEPQVDRLVSGYADPRPGLTCFDGTFAEQMMRADLRTSLPDDMLAKVDRASMAVGLETRAPLLDHRLVEFAFRLPLSLRVGKLGSKHLLKRVLYRYVPPSLVDRPKQGFSVPLGRWLRHELRPLLEDHLSPARIKSAGILDPDLVAAELRTFLSGASIHFGRVWLLLAFEIWRERWSSA
ncbi:MAG: asparagine synthase (glutamine-hydrolyzing) [Acidobacteriota bacterium]